MRDLAELGRQLQLRAVEEDGPSFMGKPDRWWDAGRWRCPNDHVSTMLLKTEKGRVCVACYEPVWLTFPEDEEGPLDSGTD